MRSTITILASTLLLASTQLGGCATAQIPDDDVIAARVKSELGRAVPRTATDLTVTSNDGVVRVTGPVVSQDAAWRAVEAARHVGGVEAVQYELWLAGTR